MFEVLGLGPAAEAVYGAMLEQTGARAEKLVGVSDLSEAEVLAGMNELVELGLVRSSHEMPGLWRAVSLPVGLEMILRRREEDLARRALELAEMKATFTAMVAHPREFDPEAMACMAERLIDADTTQAKLELLVKDAKSECLCVTPGRALSPALLDVSRTMHVDLLGRSIPLLAMHQDSVRNDPATLSYVQWLAEQGGQIRTAPVLPPRMLVFDREIVVIPLDPDDVDRGALCIREPAIVALLVAVFEEAWSSAVDLGGTPPRDSKTGLSAGERGLLVLLAQGRTDQAAAQRLGLSLRTVRRQMASLMERLEATSRFEAGLKAAKLGWL